jgi:Type II secretion system (T2SS), protein G
MSLLETSKTKNGRCPTTTKGLKALSGLETVSTTDPWGNPYQYQSLGKLNDHDLASSGARGVPGGELENANKTRCATSSLITELFEYTPTHGLDVEAKHSCNGHRVKKPTRGPR